MSGLLAHTPWTLAELNEQEFDRVTAYLERSDAPRAKWLVEVVDAVADAYGTYEREGLELLDDCPFTQAHTRHWCGHLVCRDS